MCWRLMKIVQEHKYRPSLWRQSLTASNAQFSYKRIIVVCYLRLALFAWFEHSLHMCVSASLGKVYIVYEILKVIHWILTMHFRSLWQFQRNLLFLAIRSGKITLLRKRVNISEEQKSSRASLHCMLQVFDSQMSSKPSTTSRAVHI